MVPGILTTLTREDTGGGNAVAVSGSLVADLAFNDESPSVNTARGVDRRVGFRQGLQWRYHEYDKFAALNTLQLAGTPVLIEFDFGGTTYTYDPVRVACVPLFGQLDDKYSIHIADAATAGDPSGVGVWVELGTILGGSTPNLTANTKPDGLGRPLYVSTSLAWTVEFIDDVAAALQAYETADAKIAIEHEDGTFTMIDNVQVSSIVNPTIGVAELVTRQAVFSGAWRNVLAASGAFTFPATPPDFFNGVQCVGVAAGASESDVLTIA